jgi:hypothetical protein
MLTVRIVAGREGAEQVDREGVHDLRVDWLSQHSPEPNAFLKWTSVLQIRIRMFLGLQDPDPVLSLFVWIRILPSSSRKSIAMDHDSNRRVNFAPASYYTTSNK